MIEETARVVECQAPYAWVETNRKSACDQCSMNKGCGTGVLSKVFGEKRSRIKVINKISAHEGDNVLIGINESALLTGSLLVYLLPIASLLGFALFGELLTKQLLVENQDILPILFGISGLSLAMWWVRRKTANLEQASRYQAVILRRLSNEENCIIEVK
ncbi:MAG: SoxR reducing system RseC family protein [Gammaproteobacteria bacterium]|nr:SoxR reducing system RseC family protein [Gammaproteobacteria bacterium]